jgi:hypothetical protein
VPRGLGNTIMPRQPNATACWLTVADFCLRCLDLPQAEERAAEDLGTIPILKKEKSDGSSSSSASPSSSSSSSSSSITSSTSSSSSSSSPSSSSSTASPSSTSHDAMAGSGNPIALLRARNIPVESYTEVSEATLTAAAAWVISGKPVICCLESAQVANWRHAIVLVGALPRGARMSYKDPALPNPEFTRQVRGTDLLQSFPYASRWQMNINAYCSGMYFIG